MRIMLSMIDSIYITEDVHASLIVPPLEGYGKHVGLGRGVVACIRAHANVTTFPTY